jgi:hypothetical protein
MVYRYLRTLEGINPPLSLVHLSCQATAKAFVATCESVSGPAIEHKLICFSLLQYLTECFRWVYVEAEPTLLHWVLELQLLHLGSDRGGISCTVRSNRKLHLRNVLEMFYD